MLKPYLQRDGRESWGLGGEQGSVRVGTSRWDCRPYGQPPTPRHTGAATSAAGNRVDPLDLGPQIPLRCLALVKPEALLSVPCFQLTLCPSPGPHASGRVLDCRFHSPGLLTLRGDQVAAGHALGAADDGEQGPRCAGRCECAKQGACPVGVKAETSEGGQTSDVRAVLG